MELKIAGVASLAHGKSARLKDKEYWLVFEDLLDKKICLQPITRGPGSIGGLKIRIKTQKAAVFDDYVLASFVLEPFRFVLSEIVEFNR